MLEVINNIIYLTILNGHSKNEVDDSCFPILAARKTIVFSEQKAKTFFRQDGREANVLLIEIICFSLVEFSRVL
jgi:hypothetical protein